MSKTEEIGQTKAELQAGSTTRERILDAASQTFIEKGYARATTRLIAASAGVTEVTLFRHFGSKKALFNETAQRYIEISGMLQRLEAGKSGDLTSDLMHFGRVIMEIFQQRQGVMRLVISEADRHPEVHEAVAEGPRALRHFLTGYLQEQIDAGRIRKVPAELAARQFLGMFFSLILTHSLMGDPAEPELEASQAVPGIVDVFIHGISYP